MTLKSIKLPKSKRATDNSLPSPDTRDGYPYGTRIELQDESLNALGIKELPEVGSIMMIECKVTVVGARQSASENNTTRTLELQITDMDLGADDDEVSEGELTRGESKSIKSLAKNINKY